MSTFTDFNLTNEKNMRLNFLKKLVFVPDAFISKQYRLDWTVSSAQADVTFSSLFL